MIVHPDIAALRSSPASQRSMRERIEAAQARWFAREDVNSVRRELSLYARGCEFSELGALANLLGDLSVARRFLTDFTDIFAEALRDQPLCEIPFQFRSSEGFSRLQLMREGSAVLSLCTYEPMPDPDPPAFVKLVDCEAYEIVVAGTARCSQHRFAEDVHKFVTSRSELRPGDCLAREARRDARHIIATEQSLVLLQLTRESEAATPTCEYRLADGALVQRSSGDRRTSEDVMALAVLGALEAHDAIPQMRGIALDMARDVDVRWEAVRQVLAMDTGEGVALLGGFQDTDPLASSANALLAQLVDAHPALRELIKEDC